MTMSILERDCPSIEDYATVEAICDGVPVYSFSNIVYVYGASPDLTQGMAMQVDNANPVKKIKLKKSWEIKHGWLGSNHEMTPKSARNDAQPFLPIHLVDGDPDTVWSTWGCHTPDGRQEWIRIDLPVESIISSVALICSQNFGYGDFGNALPKELEVRLSRDASHWETVYENKSFEGDASGTTVLEFESRPVKQVWILANNLQKKGKYQQMGYIFSIGEVEVRAPDGTNLALASRGGGVTVSSVGISHDNDRFTQNALWAPVQYDLGLKWVRSGLDCSHFWPYTEHEKGKLKVDESLDEAATEVTRNGINFIMNLDLKGNWIYADPPRKTDWRMARIREMNVQYDDGPPGPTSSEEMFQAYLRYVDYMVRHFKDRVQYFELGNEWDTGMSFDDYLDAFHKVYEVVKNAFPEARVVNGATIRYYPGILCLLAPGSSIEDGKLSSPAWTILTADEVNVRDVRVSVDGSSEAPFGIVLRYTGSRRVARWGRHNESGGFVAAIYDPQQQEIRFQEVVGDSARVLGTDREIYGVTPAKGLSSHVHLEAIIDGSKINFTVSDGEKTFSASHEVIAMPDELPETGYSAGLYHWPNASQSPKMVGTFQNFHIMDLSGNAILKEEFGNLDERGRPIGWSAVIGHWHRKSTADMIDGFAWHASYGEIAMEDFAGTIKQLKRNCEALGFKGLYLCNEVYAGSSYPLSPHAQNDTEIDFAIELCKIGTRHSALDVASGPCHPHFTGFPHPQSLCRQTWPAQTIVPCQPSMAYYMYRNIATILAEFRAAEFPMTIESDGRIESYTLKHEDGRELMVAAWIAGKRKHDSIEEVKADFIFPEIEIKQAWGVDSMNGTQQELEFACNGYESRISGMMVRDYPVFARLVY